ncbi:MAG: polysaccharide deacetylase family protein [Deltaproteobacteria bacterium]|nr:polysaccharide deacetylase family protein [Deltaproteobacteria bacterium]
MRTRGVRAPAALLLLALPAAALAYGSIDDVRFKTKGTDGNLWEPLLGGGALVRGHERPGTIAFTFDDGPDHRTTPVLLDELDRYGVKAAFFVSGHRFHPLTAGGAENQAVLRDMVRRGHVIGNHGFSHKDVTALDEQGWRDEVTQVELLVKTVTGRKPTLFRPPFGRLGAEARARLEAEGYTVVMWNLDPLDWQPVDARSLLDRVKKVVAENPAGGVLLMHDTNRTVVEAFPMIMEWLAERNAVERAAGRPGLEIAGLESYVTTKSR